jgi:hypothetical protein
MPGATNFKTTLQAKPKIKSFKVSQARNDNNISNLGDDSVLSQTQPFNKNSFDQTFTDFARPSITQHGP